MDHNNMLMISVKQGEDFSARIEWVDDNGDGMRLATEAANQNALMQVRNHQGDLVIELRADQKYTDKHPITDENLVNDAYQGYIYIYPKGELHLFIPWHVSDRIPVGTYWFDLFADVDLYEENAFKPSGTTQRRSVMAGKIHVRPRITEPFLD